MMKKSDLLLNQARPQYLKLLKKQVILLQFKKQFVDNEAWVLSYREECFDAIGLFIKSKRPGEEPEKKESKKEPAKEEGEKKGLGGKLKSAWDKI